MKLKAIVVGVVFVIFILGMISANAITWHTYREDITITSGHVDISENKTIGFAGGITTGTRGESGSLTYNETYNFTLPTNIDNLTTMTFIIHNASGTADESMYFNLTVNGIGVNLSTLLEFDEVANVSKLMWTEAGGDVNDTWINYSFNATDISGDIGVITACLLNLTLEGVDATLDTTWLATLYNVTEYDVTIPTVGMSQAASFWTVNNSCNVSNALELVNLTGMVLNITYPGHTVGTPTASTLNFSADTAWGSTVNSINGSEEMYLQYQKRGPFVYDVDEEIDGNEHEVTIKLKCEEVLTSVVDWTIDPDDEKYDGFFDTLDFDTLNVKLGTVNKDWDQDGDSIELEDITVFDAIVNNKWIFTWTVSVPVIPAVPTMWDSFVSYMVANWLWVLGGIAVIGAVGGIYIYAVSGTSKPRKKKK